MREIKYKAFIKRLKLLVPVQAIYFDDKEVLIDLTNGQGDFSVYLFDEIELVQYTGLKDKNSKEIYEGDIIRRYSWDWDVDEVYKVIWGGSDYPAFDVSPWHDSEMNFFSEYANDGEFGTLEVIGNIYENPSLLEVQK